MKIEPIKMCKLNEKLVFFGKWKVFIVGYFSKFTWGNIFAFFEVEKYEMHVNLTNNDGHKILIWIVDCG